MKRPLTHLMLLIPTLAIVPGSATQTAQPPLSPTGVPMRSPGQIIAQLPNFQTQLPNFTPSVDGFQFTNKELTQAMAAATKQGNWEQYWQGSLPFMFGEAACIEGTSGDTCILTAPARRWIESQTKMMRNGVCEGIATASFYLWLAKNSPDGKERTHLYTSLDEFFDRNRNTASNLGLDNSALQSYIADLFILQMIDEVLIPTEIVRDTDSPNQIFDMLLQAMQSEPDNPYTIGIYRQTNGKLLDGHTLAPFAIEDKGNDIYWVYVYDSNFPQQSPDQQSPYIEFDTSADRWRYQPDANDADTLYEGDSSTQNLDITQLSLRDLRPNDYFRCPFCRQADEQGVDIQQTGGQGVDIFLAGQGDILITNGAGQKLGFDANSNTYFEEISQADISPFRGGLDKDVPPGYSLPPSSAPYTVTLSGKTFDCADNRPTCEKRVDLVMAGMGFTIGFEGIQLDKDEQLTLHLQDSATGPKLAFTTSNDVEIADLFIALDDDELQSSYSFEIESLTLPPRKTVVMAVDRTQQQLYFWDNDGQDDVYRLTLSYISRSSEAGDGISLPNVPVAANEIAAFNYGEWEWEQLSGEARIFSIPLSFDTTNAVLSADPIALLAVNEADSLDFAIDRPVRGWLTASAGNQFQNRSPSPSPTPRPTPRPTPSPTPRRW
jgi:hypothetical protein